MTEKDTEQALTDSDADSRPNQRFIDEIYEIALDPGNLDGFIDRFESEAAEAANSRDQLLKIEALSALFKSHLTRAEVFLDRVTAQSSASPISIALAPFNDSAALIVDPNLRVAEGNERARTAFQVSSGDSVQALPFAEEDLEQLLALLQRLFRDSSSQSALVHLRPGDRPARNHGKVVVFHARWLGIDTGLGGGETDRIGHVLLTSTELSWPGALDQTLHEVFGLTEAEREILRALVEGTVLKTIARDRDRSVGTVRIQVKSILAKTHARSQSELIRITLSLMEVLRRTPALHKLGTTDLMVKSPYASLQFEPFQKLRCQDGRNMDYLVQGDPNGSPVLFSHMGYGLLRWPPKALALAMQHRIKIISPVRPGFGGSDAVGRNDDVLRIIREDTVALLDHLNVDRCPYVAQGNDMLFALDYALNDRSRVSSIVGLGARLPLPSSLQYPGMGKWHRFLFANARHAPHLLYFTCKAAFTLGRKIGREAIFFSIHKNSPADMAVRLDPDLVATLVESSKLALSDSHHAAFAYAKELLETESNWQETVHAARDIPISLVSGMQDPLGDARTIAAYEEFYPWLKFELIADAGQLLFFQKYHELIPRIAALAHEG